MRMRLRIVVCLALGIFGAACAQPAVVPSADAQAGPDSAPTADVTPSQEVGPEGGVVAFDGVRLTVPAGALSTRVAIRVERADLDVPSGYAARSAVYRFLPEGLRFASPARVAIPFAGSGPAPGVIWSREGGGYDDLPSSVEGDHVSASVTHFSLGFAGRALADAGATMDAGGDAATPPDAGSDAATAPDAACADGLLACAGGCVDPRTDPAHCGGCGRACAGSSARCLAGACAPTCAPGRMDCNGDPADGCEAAVDVDARRCGACGRACAAGEGCVAGACAAGGRPAFAPTVDVVLSAGAHEFASVDVPAGVTVRTDGSGVLDLRVAGAVTVAGAFDLSGADGRAPEPCTSGPVGSRECLGGRGGATGRPGISAVDGRVTEAPGDGGRSLLHSDMDQPGFDSGTGGAGVAGGGGGGSAASAANGSFPGHAGAGDFGGRGGGCPIDTMDVVEARAGCGYSGGGRAGVEGYAGGNSAAPVATSFERVGGWVGWRYDAMAGGGGSIGDGAARDLPMATTFRSGSGGGGGGSAGLGDALAGGGGGGGGGALRLISQSRITLAATARVYANGGAGGRGQTAGGGGSGGAIYLGAPAMDVRAGAVVSATGAAGGGPGRIRLSVGASCALDGTFSPALAGGCTRSTAAGTPLRVYVGTWPD